LGVEVESVEAVDVSATRLKEAGLAAFDERDTTCCYALQDKVWVTDPAGAPWEIYTVKDDNPVDGRPATASISLLQTTNDGACCTPAAVGAMAETAGACC
jgi:hypothetical protein